MWFEKDRDVFHGGFTFHYFYDYDEYEIGDQPLKFTLGNFNYVWFEFNYRSLTYRYVSPERVLYLEMVDFFNWILFGNSKIGDWYEQNN